MSSVRNTETKAKRAERVLSNQRRVLEGVMAVEEIVAAIMNAPDRRVSYRGAVILIQVSQCKGMATLSELMGVGDLCAESLVRDIVSLDGLVELSGRLVMLCQEGREFMEAAIKRLLEGQVERVSDDQQPLHDHDDS